MNDNTQISPKIKKYTIAFGICALSVAILGLIAADSGIKTDFIETTTAEKAMDVEVKVTNVPDNRTYETIIVPATEITTKPESAESVTEEITTRSAPVVYSLPLGTDIGNDYSCGVPVYNDIMNDWRTHDGVDFNGGYGDGVRAVADGVVTDVYDDPVMGSTVVVDHGGGVVATYSGVIASEDIRRGVFVDACDKLGELTAIPCETDSEFPHLHFEIAVNGEICDPLEVMGFYE